MNSLGERLSACIAGVLTARLRRLEKNNVGASSTPLHAPVMVKPGAYMVLPRSTMLVYLFLGPACLLQDGDLASSKG